MEGRRVEGVFLDTAVLRNRAYEAYETARVYEIQILSKVPEALLASLGDVGTRFRATVKEMNPQYVLLMLENGYEIQAENKLALPVKVGEKLTLVLESKNPLTLRVESSFQGVRGFQDILRKAVDTGMTFLEFQNFKENVENSGLIYEKKVWDFLRGNAEEKRILSDQKYAVLRFLNYFDISDIEDLLRKAELPEELADDVKHLLELADQGKKIEFFRGLFKLSKEINFLITSRKQKLSYLQDTVRSVVRDLIDNMSARMRSSGFEVSISKDVLASMEASPKTLDILREALKSLELNRWGDFTEKLSLLGIKVEGVDRLPELKSRIVSELKELVQGAMSAVLIKTESENLQELSSQLKNLREDIKKLSDMKRYISELPRDLQRSLDKLETINYLQLFLIAREGKKFILPFKTEEGKGLLGFSAEDLFRILIKLDFEEGYLGVLIEAPKKEKPEFVSVIFKTNIENLKKNIVSKADDLKAELQGLGFDVKRLEVVEESSEGFEAEIASEFGEEGMFNLRV